MAAVERTFKDMTIRFDGRMFHIINTGPRTDIEVARQMGETMAELGGGRPYPVLIDARKATSNPTAEAKQYLSTPQYQSLIAYMSVILEGQWVVNAARMYSSVAKFPYEIDYYTSHQEAFAALAERYPDCYDSPLRPREQRPKYVASRYDRRSNIVEIEWSPERIDVLSLRDALSEAVRDFGPLEALRPDVILRGVDLSMGDLKHLLTVDQRMVRKLAVVVPQWVRRMMWCGYRQLSRTLANKQCHIVASRDAALGLFKARSNENLLSEQPENITMLIVQALERFAQGDFAPVDPEKYARNDELRIFFNVINILSAKIHQQISELETANEQLEARVTERTQQLEEQRHRSIEQARLAAIGRFASSLAHELNNPLAVVHASIDLLKKKQAMQKLTPESLSEKLEIMSKMVHRATNIVKSVRNISRDSSSDPVFDENLEELVTDNLSMVEAAHRNAGVRVETQLSEGIRVACRKGEIGQVLINLLNNAKDAIEDLPPADRWIKLETFVREKTAVVRVSNGGPVLGEDVEAKMMEPFFTTKAVGKGTGLGLSLSQTIAKLHGGHLCFVREGYTTFELVLPVGKNA